MSSPPSSPTLQAAVPASSRPSSPPRSLSTASSTSSLSSSSLSASLQLTVDAVTASCRTTFGGKALTSPSATQAQPQPFQAVIASVGSTPAQAEALAAALIALRPDYVCLVHTTDTERVIDDVLALSHFRPSRVRQFLVTLERWRTVYDALRRCLSFLCVDKRIAERDICYFLSGGQNVVSFTAGTICSSFNLSLLYFHSTWDAARARSTPGTERVVVLRNLQTCFNDGDFFFLTRLLLCNEYSSAVIVLRKCFQSSNRVHLLLSLLLNGLAKWHNFEYEGAIVELQAAQQMLLDDFSDETRGVPLRIVTHWLAFLRARESDACLQAIDTLTKSVQLEMDGAFVEAITNSFVALEHLVEYVCVCIGLRRYQTVDLTTMQEAATDAGRRVCAYMFARLRGDDIIVDDSVDNDENDVGAAGADADGDCGADDVSSAAGDGDDAKTKRTKRRQAKQLSKTVTTATKQKLIAERVIAVERELRQAISYASSSKNAATTAESSKSAAVSPAAEVPWTVELSSQVKTLAFCLHMMKPDAARAICPLRKIITSLASVEHARDLAVHQFCMPEEKLVMFARAKIESVVDILWSVLPHDDAVTTLLNAMKKNALGGGSASSSPSKSQLQSQPQPHKQPVHKQKSKKKRHVKPPSRAPFIADTAAEYGAVRHSDTLALVAWLTNMNLRWTLYF